MHALIAIPAFNEESTLDFVLASLPETFDGGEVVDLLVIDDGSTDQTADIAR